MIVAHVRQNELREINFLIIMSVNGTRKVSEERERKREGRAIKEIKGADGAHGKKSRGG